MVAGRYHNNTARHRHSGVVLVFHVPQRCDACAYKTRVRFGLSADDLTDACQGVPTLPSQLNLCVVALRNSQSKEVEFYISYTHLFGRSAAVVNFNGVPELMTAACRRIGAAPSWHSFDDPGMWNFKTNPIWVFHK